MFNFQGIPRFQALFEDQLDGSKKSISSQRNPWRKRAKTKPEVNSRVTGKPSHKRHLESTLPETNSKFAPEKGTNYFKRKYIDSNHPLSGSFRCKLAVSFRESTWNDISGEPAVEAVDEIPKLPGMRFFDSGTPVTGSDSRFTTTVAKPMATVPILNGCFWFPQRVVGSIYPPEGNMVYKWYILPIGGLYATYHLLGEPETTIDILIYWLVVFLNHPSEKYAQVKFEKIFPNFRGENKKSLSCHHLLYHWLGSVSWIDLSLKICVKIHVADQCC